ncbi:MAG: HD domain-containing protein [Candidatus Bathyarchaeota archaeon]|nr:MAG: HD domain-containing protein [Candidatus Bathyarchaeota archaeon]
MLLDNLLKFSKIIGKLKSIRRSGWVSQVGVDEPESVADHSFRTTVLAMCICDLSGAATEKIIRMILLHDIHEAQTGDFDQKAKKQLGAHQVRSQQRSAIKNILSLLPPKMERQYQALWSEFEAQETYDAILANDIDKIEMVIQALEYEKEGYDSAKLDIFWKSTRSDLKTSLVQDLFKYLATLRERSLK